MVLGKNLIFECRNLFWPIVIWPYYENSHTIQLIGWRNNNPHILKNVKISFAGTVRITEKGIDIKHLYLGRLISIQIGVIDIKKIQIYANDNDLIEVNFQKVKINNFMQFVLKGAPSGKIFLNLGKRKGEFLEKTELWCFHQKVSRNSNGQFPSAR